MEFGRKLLETANCCNDAAHFECKAKLQQMIDLRTFRFTAEVGTLLFSEELLLCARSPQNINLDLTRPPAVEEQQWFRTMLNNVTCCLAPKRMTCGSIYLTCVYTSAFTYGADTLAWCHRGRLCILPQVSSVWLAVQAWRRRCTKPQTFKISAAAFDSISNLNERGPAGPMFYRILLYYVLPHQYYLLQAILPNARQDRRLC